MTNSLLVTNAVALLWCFRKLAGPGISCPGFRFTAAAGPVHKGGAPPGINRKSTAGCIKGTGQHSPAHLTNATGRLEGYVQVSSG